MPDTPMKKPGELHIIKGPVFSAYTNNWGADCSCGWKTSHHTYTFVDWAVTQHRLIADGLRIKRRELVGDKKTGTWPNMPTPSRTSTDDAQRLDLIIQGQHSVSEGTKTCPACAEEVPASVVWCMLCGFRSDSA